MNNFLKRLLITTLSLGVASYLINGIVIHGGLTLVIAAMVFNIVNTFIRPILLILTIPFTIVTFGLFLFILNGMMLAITAAVLPGFYITSIGSAVIGWMVMSITSWLAGAILDNDKNN